MYVVDAATGAVERHAQTLQGYDDDGYQALLVSAGFERVRLHASLTGWDEDAEPGLFGITARVPGGIGRRQPATADATAPVR